MEKSLENKICELYKTNKKLPSNLIDMILNPQKLTLKEKRILSIQEIIDASSDMQIDFITLKIIPFIDCYDNDYICYDFQSEGYLIFNTVDEVRFKHSKDLNYLLNYKN